MNDPLVVRYLESRYAVHTAEDLLEFVRAVRADPDSMIWAICVAGNADHVGNIKLGPVDWVHRHGDIGLMIGEQACWGLGYATEAIDLVSEYASRALGLHRLTAGSYSENTASIRAFQRAGFEIDGVWRDHYVSGTGVQDRICLGMVCSPTDASLSGPGEGWTPHRSAKLAGSDYRLVPFTESLITEQYLGWLNNPEINRFLEVRHATQTEASARVFLRSFDARRGCYLWCIESRAPRAAIGTATLQANGDGDTAELGIMIGEKEYWGRGAAAEALDLAIQFGFSHLNLRKLTAGSYSVNMPMNFTLRRLGLTREGTIRRAFALDGEDFADEFRWGVFPDEWKPQHTLRLEQPA